MNTTQQPKPITAQGVKIHLQPHCEDLQINVIPLATSTNVLVSDQAALGAPEGYVLIANEQSAGRGRRGRSFYSPSGSGIYLSILLRPVGYSAREASHITTMAAVAVCEAIEAVTDEKAHIKWVNDIFVCGKKVCGILTEASLNMESSLVDYAVLGVGINVYEPENGFIDGLENIAGSLLKYTGNDIKEEMTAAFLNSFMLYFRNLAAGTGAEDEGFQMQPSYTQKYRARSLAIGRQVQVLSGNQSRQALVLSINDDCELLVKYEDGTQENLSSGEISICL